MKKMKMLLSVGALTLGLFTVAQANILVDLPYTTNLVIASAACQGKVSGYVPFSMTAVRSPATGYTGPVFFGGATGSIAITSWSVVSNATVDYISASGSSTGIGSRLVGAIMFTNQSATITQVVWSIRQGGSAGNQTSLVSIVVGKSDGSFYISDKMSAKSTIVLTNSNLGALAWYNYDPNSGLDARGSLVSGFTLDNVTSVGEWQENIITVSGSLGVGISTFQAFGTVPEPATIGMLGLGALITMMVRRMRN